MEATPDRGWNVVYKTVCKQVTCHAPAGDVLTGAAEPPQRRRMDDQHGIWRPGGEAAAGWRAQLELHFAERDGRTAVVHRQHQGPLVVQRPFYPEREVCHCYLLHPPGGVVGGDRLQLRIQAQRGAHALLTTPAAGKFYRSLGAQATQQVDIQLCGARFEWLPQETIFYPQAMARVETCVQLDDDSRLIAWELGSYGLPARNEAFFAGRVNQCFAVWKNGRPLLHDRLFVEGGSEALNAPWGLAGHSVVGTFVAYPVQPAQLDALRAATCELSTGGRLALSCVDGLLVGRALDAHADAILRRFVALWRQLRPQLMQREVCVPRIWAT